MSTGAEDRLFDALGAVLGRLVLHGEATMVVLAIIAFLAIAARLAYIVVSLWADLRLKRNTGDAAGALAGYLQGDAAGRSGDYVSYMASMASSAWQARSARTIMLAGGACQHQGPRCTGKATQAHHRHYRDFTHEADASLLAVCKPCHDELHGR